MSIETTKLTASQFLELGPDPAGVRLELIDGEVIGSPSPTPEHSRIDKKLTKILLNYIDAHDLGELYGDAPTMFECASAATQFEALRAGLGLGVVHDYIARRFPDLRAVLPGRRATRTYWLVTHEDTRGLGRIRAVCEHLIACVARDRAKFV